MAWDGASRARSIRGTAIAGVGTVLVYAGKDLKSVDLGERITSVAGSSPHSRPRVVATFKEGAAVQWVRLDPDDPQHFAKDLTDPRGAFTRDGLLALVSGREGRIYDTGEHQVVLRAEFTIPVHPKGDPRIACRPLSVVPGEKPNEFAVFVTDGRVFLYEVKE